MGVLIYHTALVDLPDYTAPGSAYVPVAKLSINQRLQRFSHYRL